MVSKFEQLTRDFFKHCIHEKPVFNYRPDWLRYHSGKNLELDIFYPQIKLAVEINGFLHQGDYQIEKDTFKKEECRRNGIYLLSITKIRQLLDKRVLDLIRSKTGKDVKIPYSLVSNIKNYHPGHIKKLDKLVQVVIWQKKRREYKAKLNSYALIQKAEIEANKKRRECQNHI